MTTVYTTSRVRPAHATAARLRLWSWLARVATAAAALLYSTIALGGDSTPGVDSGGMLRALLALALVLLAVFAIAWVARRISPSPMSGNWLKLQGGLSVGARERVLLVEVKDTWLVLGVAPGNVNVLHTLPRPDEADAPQTNPTRNGFSTWLNNAIRRRNDA